MCHLDYVCRGEAGHEELGAGVAHARQLEVGGGHHQVLHVVRRDGNLATDVGGQNHGRRRRSRKGTKKAGK